MFSFHEGQGNREAGTNLRQWKMPNMLAEMHDGLAREVCVSAWFKQAGVQHHASPRAVSLGEETCFRMYIRARRRAVSQNCLCPKANSLSVPVGPGCTRTTRPPHTRIAPGLHHGSPHAHNVSVESTGACFRMHMCVRLPRNHKCLTPPHNHVILTACL